MTSLFCCPVCSKQMNKESGSYRCESSHCFDIAKEGYTNLLISGKNSAVSGDDKEMVKARTRFLEGGYYSVLRDKLCELIKENLSDNSVILDSGCGEGYYTKAITETAKSKASKVCGVDLSKAAIRHAAKNCKEAEFAVASVYRLPLSDSSVDLIINCFSPMASEEFSRVLKENGLFFYVVPGAKHLWELKSVLYDVPYENEEKITEYDCFTHIKEVSVDTKFSLTEKEDIMALYHMTPYTWTTPKDGAARLSDTQELNVTASFHIHVYRKVSH